MPSQKIQDRVKRNAITIADRMKDETDPLVIGRHGSALTVLSIAANMDKDSDAILLITRARQLRTGGGE